jgi:hypothetical protein
MKLTKGKAMRDNCNEEKKQSRKRTARPVLSWLVRVTVLAVLLCLAAGRAAEAQTVTTTTVQGTVYLANGQPGAGTLDVSWPAFTTSSGSAVTAGRLTVTIAADGFMSVNLTPNLGATPAGLFYTAVYHMSDGTTSTEYWVIPAAAQAALGQVRAQVMPAAQAVQAVTKAYVDQAVAALNGSYVPLAGGTMTGPLYLNGDPAQPLQASDKHYVDTGVATAVPLAGGNMTGALTTPSVNGVQSPTTVSSQTTLQAAINSAGSTGALEIPPTYTGTDTFTNANGVYVKDWRTSGAQQAERSVKEFGAVCDGSTNDTSALQTALNYANAHGVALTIPQGTCKTHALSWHGESIGGLGKQVSALMGFPGEDVLVTPTDSTSILSYTRLNDLSIYVDQSVDASCATAKGRARAGSCALSRPIESNSIFSPGGNGLTATVGLGAGWYVGNCAIAMPALTGAGGNGLKVATIENVEIAPTGTDPLAASYAGAYSTHTCGMYLGQWPRWSTFRNIDIRGLNTGIAMPALAGITPSGLNADSNKWENITMQAAHGFVAATGSNNVMDNVVGRVGNSAATAEPPTGLVLDLSGAQYGWTVRNAVVLPTWTAVPPALTVAALAGAITGVTVGSEHGLGFDPYGTAVPVQFGGSCTAQATAAVNSDGSIGAVMVTQGGVACSVTTTASLNVAGGWDTAAPVNLIGGQNLSFLGGNLSKGTGGYTVWNATASELSGTQVAGGGGNLPGGGTYGALTGTSEPGSAYQAEQFPGADFGAKLGACVNAVSSTYGGTCDARNFTGAQTISSNVTIAASNTTVLLPCATITTANQLIVAAGVRNVSLKGCALRGGSQASGSMGGTAIAYTGSGAAVQVGDGTYAVDTLGFHMDNVVINTTGASSASAAGLVAYRTQEMDVESVYFLGNSNQTGMTLDGTGNYTGGTYYDNAFNGFQTAVNAIGHQVSSSVTTDWTNASTFVRLHVDCPTSGGSPIAGTYGINLQAGDGNTFTGGDVEGCSTALHLGSSAKNNTIVGLRNENSTNQVVADAGSAYNNWMTGGTMFTGALTDNGTRNSFLDTFHRSFNGMNGDWYGSQQDATVTNHYRLGTGAGNERGLLDRYQTDYGYRWTMGLSDATSGEQFYQVLDELNSVYRISVGQYNNGQSSTNNQTVINAAGSGAVVLNGSNNAGTGGVVFGSGGSISTTVATVDKQGDAIFNGTLQVGGTTTFVNTPTVKNGANAEIDMTLWAGSTASQKESYIYKDYNGNSQWYMVKDTSNNWALNSAVGGLDSFKAYQSTNTGDTYVDASNATGTVRINYETNSGSAFNIYGGGTSVPLYASFTGAAAIKFPGLSASSGHNCLQIDSSGYITNTGSGCGSNTTSGTTVSSGTTGQIAYYTGNGTSVGGETSVPVAAGGTGATTAAAAMTNLGGVSTTVTSMQTMAGPLTATGLIPATTPYADIRAYGAVIDGATPIDSALVSAVAAACTSSGSVLLPCGGNGCYLSNGSILAVTNGGFACSNSTVVQLKLQGKLILGSTFETPDQVDLIGDGQSVNQSFQAAGPVASVQGPAVYGTLGTAVSSTNAPVSFTPVFTNGSITNMPAGSAITIAGTTNCAISSIARASNVVTATLSASCTIPAGTTVTVAGVTDTSFNTTPMVTASDYGAMTLRWQQSGTNGSSSGGTVTGFNESSFETVRIQSVSGSTVTAVFTHGHNASDQWGMVAIAPPASTYQHHGFENLRVYANYGAGFWGEHNALLSFKNMAFSEVAAMTSIPMEMSSSWWFTISQSTLLPTLGHACGSSCGQQGYPYAFRCTAEGSYLNPSDDGCAAEMSFIDKNSVIGGGIKLDTNGIAQSIGGLTVRDTVIEQPINNAVTEDISAASQAQQPITFDHVLLQDSFMGYGFSWINYLYPQGANRCCANVNEFVVNNFSSVLTPNIVGKYYSGRVLVNGLDYYQGGITLPMGRTAPVGTIADGSITMTELDGIGGSLGPSLIPAATQAVNQNPSSWPGVTGGILAPDGTYTAGELDATNATSYSDIFHFLTVPRGAGDCFLVGSWVRAGANQTYAGGSFSPIYLWSYGSDVFDQGASYAMTGAFQQNIGGNWWHPIVGLTCLTSGSSSSYISMRLSVTSNSSTTIGNQFWKPFMIYIPASANVPRNEIERWRQQLLHGVVPPSIPAGGGILAVDATHKIYWGSDTNLYRSAPGVLTSDGAIDAGTGFKCQGSFGSSGQVLTSTGSGCQWTGLTTGVLSFSGDGVVLSNSASTGSVTATLKAAQPNMVLAGPASGGTSATPSYRGLTSADLPANITASTSGAAARLSAASALPNGTTAATQAQGDGSTQVATTAYVDTGLSGKAATTAATTVNGQTCTLGSSCTVAATPGGSAAGDLSGSYPSPTVVKVNGGAVPLGASLVATNSSGQLVNASSATLANNTTGNAATASALATTPTQCPAGTYSTGVSAVGASNCSQVNASQLGSGALASGTTATTQTQGDESTKVATTAYVDTGLNQKASVTASTTVNGKICSLGGSCTITAELDATAGGDLSGSYPSPAVAKINGISLAGLATGLLKNTAVTGVPTIAAAGVDYVLPGGSITGSAASATNFTGSLNGDVTGTQAATAVVKVNGAAVPASATIVGTNASGQLVNASSATLANNTTGNAATATALAAVPVACASGYVAAGILANGNATGCIPVGSSSAVAGPGTSVSNDLASFNGTTGGNLKDTGIAASSIATTTQAVALANGMTATTQAQGDGSTKVATTGYVDSGLSGRVATTTTVNGHALSSNVTVSASDLTAGTLAHAQLPALVSGDIPNNAANTSGNAATATALAATPTTCAAGYAPTGILSNGNVTGCTALSTGSVTGPSVSVSGDLAVFSGTAGATLQDTGLAASSLATTAYVSTGLSGRVATTTTVNGHALSGNVTVSVSDLTAGALASGTTAMTQSQGDGSTKLATTAYVDTGLSGRVATTTTVNGHALSGSVAVSASDITIGTLPDAQLPSDQCVPTKYTVAYNDASLTGVSSATPTKALFTLPGTSSRICLIEISGTSSFTGISNLTAATVRLQSGAGTPLLYSPNQDVYGTVGATTNNYWTDSGSTADRTNQNVVAGFTFTCSSGSCYSTGLTAGSVNITVGVRTMP